MDNLQALSLATLVDCLRRFWTYGLAAPRIIPAHAGHEKGSPCVTPPASPRYVRSGFPNADCVEERLLVLVLGHS